MVEDNLETHSIKKVAKGGFFIFIGIVMSSLAFLFYKILAARYLGPKEYGLLTLGITILNIAALFGLAGMHHSIGKFVNNYLAKKQYGKVKGILASSFAITIAISIIISFILYFSSQFIAELFGTKELGIIIVIFAFGLPFSVLTQLIRYYFYAFKKPEYAIISESVFEKSSSVAFLAIAIYLSASLYQISWIYISSFILASIAGLSLLKNAIKKIIKKTTEAEYNLIELLNFSFPLMITGIISATLAWTDTLFIGYYHSETDVGIYNSAYIIASSFLIFWISLGDIFYPIISGLHAKKKTSSIKSVFESASRWIFLLIFPVFVFILAFPSRTISLVFGQSYLAAAIPLVILSIGYFFTTIFGLSEQGLRTFNKTKFLAISAFFGLIANIILNILLVPKYGISGAAMATTITLLALNSVKYFAFKKILKFGYNAKLYFRYVLSAAISFIAVFYTLSLLNLSGTSIFLMGFLIYILIYFLLLIALKSFSEEDKEIIKALKRKIGIN